jgi:hypothetical protein
VDRLAAKICSCCPSKSRIDRTLAGCKRALARHSRIAVCSPRTRGLVYHSQARGTHRPVVRHCDAVEQLPNCIWTTSTQPRVNEEENRQLQSVNGSGSLRSRCIRAIPRSGGWLAATKRSTLTRSRGEGTLQRLSCRISQLWLSKSQFPLWLLRDVTRQNLMHVEPPTQRFAIGDLTLRSSVN